MKNLIFILAFCLLSVLSDMDVYSQGIYHDVVPDVHFSDSHYFDINSDGINDLKVYHDWYIFIDSYYFKCLHDSIWICSTTDDYWVDSIPLHTEINESLYWKNGKFHLLKYEDLSYLGPFVNVINKFIAIRMGTEGNYKYAWMRFTYPYYLDFSYNSQLGEPIIAGQDVLHIATNLEAMDIGDNMDPTDLELSFKGALDDSPIIEYRAIVVKTENLDEFDIDTALGLPTDSYLPIQLGAGAIYYGVFNANILDSDGDTIKNMVSYNLLVLSKIESQGIDSSLLSNPSNPLQLITTASSSQWVIGEDITDFGDGRDLKVSFAKAEDESRISSYGIFVVDFFKADTFGIEQALITPEEYITFVEPTGEDIGIVLNETSTTLDGKLIVTGAYRVFVISVANGITADHNSLSDSSNLIMLINPNEKEFLAGMAPDYVSHVVLNPPLFIDFPNSNNNGTLDSLLLDLNLDDNPDIKYEISFSGGGAFEPALIESRVIAIGGSTVCVLPMEYQTPITNILPYMEGGAYGQPLAITGNSNYGPWLNTNGLKYMAVRMIEASDTSLAWIKAAIEPGEITVYEYACWEFTSGITEFSSELNVYPNPVIDFLYFEREDSLDIKSCTIYNLQGLKIEDIQLTYSQDRIDLSKLPGGIYLMQLNFEDGKYNCAKIIKR